MKTLAEWLDYLERLHPAPIDLGLERVRAVRDRLGVALDMPILTVGGTNGKGSICAYLEAILGHAGFRAGLYTSPHLVRYNERMRIAGTEVDDAAIVRAFERIESARAEISLTYFEFGTLAAAVVFSEANLDAAILEVGLGGRLDAVNVFDADCAVIASVDLDHTAYLGDNRESIGREKAGIFRPGKVAICADPVPPASLIERATAIGAPLRLIGENFGFSASGLQWNFWGPWSKRSALAYPALRGAHQLGNAAAAIAALDELKSRLPVSMQAIRMGLATAALAGRYQVLPGRPVVVLDVAHNPHAARALAQTLRAHTGFERTLAVFAMLADKDIGGVVDALKEHIAEWYVGSLSDARASSAAMLSALIAARDAGKAIHQCVSVAEAYRCAYKRAGGNDRILVFGSFHTVAAVMVSLARQDAA